MIPINNYFKTILGPEMDPKMGNLGEGPQQAEPARALLKALVSKMVPRLLKMAPSSPKPLGSLLMF